jgi:molybdate transport system regulatory protein
MTQARLSLRIDLPQGRIGPGKVALLETIAAEGSISAAGRKLGMSYRRAWALVESLNRTAGTVVTPTIGGAGGGGAKLTTKGETIIKAYRAIEAAAHATAQPYLTQLQESEGRRGSAATPPDTPAGT